METLNQPSPTQDLFSGLQIDHENNGYLSEVARWSKFLSIVGFIFTGLMALGLLISLFSGASSASIYSPLSLWAGSGLSYAVMIGVLALCFFPCLFLFKFSNKMKVALRTDDQYTMTTAFKNLKSYFKFVGIFTIVILAIYVVIIIAAMIFASRSSF